MYLHGRQPAIIHGGIHPTEFLVDNSGRAVLIDFGLNYTVTSLGPPPSQAPSLRSTLVGGYYAPEIIQQETLTKAADVYAFAGVILAVLSGVHPHHDAPVPELAWLNGNPDPEQHKNLHHDHPFWRLMEKMWSRVPSERPLMPEVVKNMEDLLPSQYYEIHIADGPAIGFQVRSSADSLPTGLPSPNAELEGLVTKVLLL
ncbi:hypothetical protein FRC00_004738 [Tulasnella sp. 408]|nr:hypothetical protein FRC00_004738 [Tulasnella sp. 408]